MMQAMRAALSTRNEIEPQSAQGPQRAPAAAVRQPDVRLSIHGDLSAIETDWRAFEQYADCTVFQSFDWLSAWQRHVGACNGVRPAIVVARDGDGAMLFLAPLAVEPAAAGFARRLTWLGSGLCDYNAPLLAPDYPTRVGPDGFLPLWHAIVERLQGHPDLRYDLVHFEKMPETVGGQRHPFLDLGVALHPSPAFVTSLGSDWETFYTARRSSSARRNDRKHRRGLEAHGDVRLVIAQEPDQIADTLDLLIEQKSAWFAQRGIANMFERPGYRDFFLDIATNAQVEGLVHLSRLAVGPHAAATNLGLQFRSRYYGIIMSYDAGELSRFGPGIAHMHEVIRHAIATGIQTFDFSIGTERYKRELCDAEIKLYDHAAAATLRGAIATIPISAKRRAKRWIKSTPALWQRVREARAFAASLFRRR